MNYIPAQDANALIWMQHFASVLSANNATYFVSEADCLAITNAVNAFAAALSVATNQGTRTPVTVAEKDDARVAAEQICRQYASLLKYNAGISDPAKIEAGVRPVNPSREPVDVPMTSPIVNPIASTPGGQTLRFADSLTPESSAKPFGATDLLLFCAVADEDVNDPAQAKFVGKFTRNPISVEFSAGDNQKIATYFARWSNRKGQMGPWSLPISMAIAA